MTTITQKIKVLFNEDLTSYSIGKAIGATPQFVDNYRAKGSSIENMRLGKAEKLIELYEQYKAKQTEEIYNVVLNASKTGTSLYFVVEYDGKILANKNTGNVNDIFSINRIIGVYGDLIGGQIDSRGQESYRGVYRAIRNILDYGKPVLKDEADLDKKFYGEI